MQNKIPKFEEGEVVILQSKDSPQYNGEHTVHKVVLGEVAYYDRILKREFLMYNNAGVDVPAYYLEAILPSQHKNNEAMWNENALKKKHLPSNESFDTLMASLKLGQPVRV